LFLTNAIRKWAKEDSRGKDATITPIKLTVNHTWGFGAISKMGGVSRDNVEI